MINKYKVDLIKRTQDVGLHISPPYFELWKMLYIDVPISLPPDKLQLVEDNKNEKKAS